MNTILLILPLVFLLCVVTDGKKYKCWEGSKKDSNEKFKESLYEKSKDECKYCWKIEMEAAGGKDYSRGCAKEDDIGRGLPKEGCDKLKSPGRFRRDGVFGGGSLSILKGRGCVCKKDLCNDASSLISSRFTEAATFLALIVWKLVTRSL